jgi:hypothetical protein
METHAKVLGILNIVFGALGLCTALFLMVVFGGVAGIVGAEADSDAAIAVPIIGATGAIVVLFMLVVALPSIIVGYALYKLQPWGRVAGIVLSIVNLLWFPLGTALGVYGLWVLFSADGQRLFEGAPTAQV